MGEGGVAMVSLPRGFRISSSRSWTCLRNSFRSRGLRHELGRGLTPNNSARMFARMWKRSRAARAAREAGASSRSPCSLSSSSLTTPPRASLPPTSSANASGSHLRKWSQNCAPVVATMAWHRGHSRVMWRSGVRSTFWSALGCVGSSPATQPAGSPYSIRHVDGRRAAFEGSSRPRTALPVSAASDGKTGTASQCGTASPSGAASLGKRGAPNSPEIMSPIRARCKAACAAAERGRFGACFGTATVTPPALRGGPFPDAGCAAAAAKRWAFASGAGGRALCVFTMAGVEPALEMVGFAVAKDWVLEKGGGTKGAPAPPPPGATVLCVRVVQMAMGGPLVAAVSLD
mmetsp:Transcript_5666/g.16074  ORF Transcript_5666/g.16074 Transcript_5666/m.16074 type:complete len:346 (-) Transcript_5666:384-1421(-)